MSGSGLRYSSKYQAMLDGDHVVAIWLLGGWYEPMGDRALVRVVDGQEVEEVRPLQPGAVGVRRPVTVGSDSPFAVGYLRAPEWVPIDHVRIRLFDGIRSAELQRLHTGRVDDPSGGIWCRRCGDESNGPWQLVGRQLVCESCEPSVRREQREYVEHVMALRRSRVKGGAR